jgi:hypothetical protein
MSPWVKPVTDSLNVMVTGIGEVLVGLEAVVESVADGAVVSITRLFPPPNDEALTRLGKVSVALALLPSVTVPPLRARAAVDRYCKSDEVCPIATM